MFRQNKIKWRKRRNVICKLHEGVTAHRDNEEVKMCEQFRETCFEDGSNVTIVTLFTFWDYTYVSIFHKYSSKHEFFF